MERAYTVTELDDLRWRVRDKVLFGSYRPGNAVSRSHNAGEVDQTVEARVRTHMLAGHTAADLIDGDQ